MKEEGKRREKQGGKGEKWGERGGGRKDEKRRNGVAQAVTSGKGDGCQKTEN